LSRIVLDHAKKQALEPPFVTWRTSSRKRWAGPCPARAKCFA
jgi:hypothetical protein